MNSRKITKAEKVKAVGAALQKLPKSVRITAGQRRAILDGVRRRQPPGQLAQQPQEPCPHVISSDEGTAYCGLAEQTTRELQEQVEKLTAALNEANQRISVLLEARKPLVALEERPK